MKSFVFVPSNIWLMATADSESINRLKNSASIFPTFNNTINQTSYESEHHVEPL